MASNVFICYSSTKNLETWVKPGTVCVPDQHRELPIYQTLRTKGVKVSPYLNMPEAHVRGVMDEEFRAFVGDTLQPWGNNRASWYPLVNVRVGAEYVKRTIEYIAQRFMPLFDGITLDVVGGQLHKKADWANWPAAERREWQLGMVDFVRLLDIKRQEIKPWFEIQTINIWEEERAGTQYVDGFYLESPAVGVSLYYRNLVNRPCGYLGQRRVTVVADTVDEAEVYAKLPGVTHVTAVNRSLGQSYAAATPPIVDQPTDNRLAEALAMRSWLFANKGNLATIAGLRAKLAQTEDGLDAALVELSEQKLTSRQLGDRVDALVGKIQAIKLKVDAEAEGVE